MHEIIFFLFLFSFIFDANVCIQFLMILEVMSFFSMNFQRHCFVRYVQIFN